MDDECPKCEEGLPPWLVTFADLMSLLMCFFVLLLSFAEVDAARFKDMAEEMKNAFGVQREKMLIEVAQGTSVIKQHFSPGKPEPTVIDDIRQTSRSEEEILDIEQAKEAVQEQYELEAEELVEMLSEMLDGEVSSGQLEVEREGSVVIIRIREKGSFPSGSASFDPEFFPVISKITDIIAATEDRIVVAGHTDNVPISTRRFRSNWELSSARAVTVVHAMLSNAAIDESRFLIEGHADSHPLESNDTAEGRAKNRRVELIMKRGPDNSTAEEVSASG